MPHFTDETWTAEDHHTAIYDPVPATCGSQWYEGEYDVPHSVECEIQRALLNLPCVEFSSLHVHRMPGGVCLTGVARLVGPVTRAQLQSWISQTAGVERVLNRLVVQTEETFSIE